MCGTSADTEVHMEKGPIGRTLLIYTVPVLLSQILQRFYNIADCIVIGHFGGSYGLSAAGAAGLILAVLVNFFVGFSTGISFITARLFGAYEYSRLKRTVQSMIYLSVLLGLLFTAVGIGNAGRFLTWLGCPPEVLGDARRYLCICFWGMAAQLLSNTGNAVLRSMGNTRSPLLYLAGSAVLNLVLDVVLAVKASMGLSGAAWATVAAQFLSRKEIGEVVRMGLSSGLQAVFMSISSLRVSTSLGPTPWRG